MRRAAAAVAAALVCACEPTAPRPALPAVADTLFGAGATQWFIADTLGGSSMRPAVDADRLYFIRGAFSGGPSELVAVDRATGRLLWHRPRTTIAGNAVVVGSAIATAWGTISFVDRAAGTLLRTYGDVVAAVTWSHGVHAFDVASGDELWSYDATRGDPGHASL